MEERNLTKFQIGDRVKHRGSGEVGIIIGISTTCVFHTPRHPLDFCSMRTDKEKCDFQPNGYYDLSIGFEKEIKFIDGNLLEKAENV